MLVDKFNCCCPECNSEQTYYHVLSGNSKYGLPPHMSNVCSKCGCALRKENIPNWSEIEKEYNGVQGEAGHCQQG